jgi:putative oxidoreductase
MSSFFKAAGKRGSRRSDERPVTGAESNIKPQTSNIPQFAWRILAILIGGIFVYAGAIKVFDPVRFANDIDNYKILPWFIGVRLAFYLPWLEIFCGAALAFRFFYRGGLSILTVLVLIFTSATVAAKVRGLDITCGCFGHASQHWSFLQHMGIDLVILAALIALLFTQRTKARL